MPVPGEGMEFRGSVARVHPTRRSFPMTLDQQMVFACAVIGATVQSRTDNTKGVVVNAFPYNQWIGGNLYKPVAAVEVRVGTGASIVWFLDEFHILSGG